MATWFEDYNALAPYKEGADAFAKRIHSRFSNRRVSDLVEATPSTKKNISFDVKKFFINSSYFC